MGLNESYAHIRGQILMMEPLPAINKVFSLVIQEERHINIGGNSAIPVSEPLAFGSNYNAPTGSSGGSKTKRDKVTCTHCGFIGHTKDKCYRLVGYPPGWRVKSKTSNSMANNSEVINQVNANATDQAVSSLTNDQCQQLIQLLSTQLASASSIVTDPPSTGRSISNFTGNVTSFRSNSGIIDSGATHHVCNDLSLFTSSVAVQSIKVTLPNGISVPIERIGSIVLAKDVKLFNVLFVPNFRYNLLSVSAFTDSLPFSLVFNRDTCFVQELSQGKTIGKGKRKGKLYHLQFDSFLADTHCIVASGKQQHSVSTLALWHSRLGHPSFSRLKLLQPVLGFSDSMSSNNHCNVCPLAKQRCLPFVSHNNRKDVAFALIHLDIWGPFATASIEGYKYFLTIVDDFSRATWIYMLKAKSDVQQHIPQFFAFVKKQFGTEIHAIRSDNAPELALSDFYRSLGVVHFRSCVETPQQNSVVERKHQHLLNVARSLFFQSNLPRCYWSDCIMTAAYLINRIPSPFLGNKTPFELIHNHLPSCGHLRTFGCLCFVSTLKAHRDKFSPRARAAIFLGYPFGFKGYKVLDLETNAIVISRNVIFHETVFPLSKRSSDQFMTPTADIFHDSVLPKLNPLPATNLPNQKPSSSTTSMPITSESPPNVSISPSKPARTRNKPNYLHDYHCSLINSVEHIDTHSTTHPIQKYLSYDNLSSSYKAFVLSVSVIKEPTSFTQASLIPEWQQAMCSELKALEDNNTWSITSLPNDKLAVGCKWVYKVKYKADGSLERYKARLVAKGYTQREGVDFTDTFSPVAKLVTVKLLLAIAAVKGWILSQLDVTNAFLHGDLDEEVYMKLPPGYHPDGVPLPRNAVCLLHKSLYGLKQASRQWFSKFSGVIISLGFRQSPSDHSLFTRSSDGHFMAILIYVDDVLIASTDPQAIVQLKADLSKAFKLKDLGTLKYFLGLEIARAAAGICVSQRKYVLDLLS